MKPQTDAAQEQLVSRAPRAARIRYALWERSMAEEQRALQRLKLRVTERCALRAYCRGKLHLQLPPRNAASDWNAVDYHRRIAERLGPTYVIEPLGDSPLLEQSASDHDGDRIPPLWAGRALRRRLRVGLNLTACPPRNARSSVKKLNGSPNRSFAR